MKTKQFYLVFLMILIIFFGVGCKKTSKSSTVPIIIQGDEVSKALLEKTIQSNPILVNPQSGTEYTLMIVKPDPSIDYKILTVQPDPSIDYSIIVIDPKTKQEISPLSSEIADALLKALKQKKK